jgi:hypothetical protein
MFDSNLHSASTEYHSFTTSDFALESLGIASYSVASLKRYLVDKPNDDVKDLFGETETTYDTLVGKSSIDSLSIILWNEDTKEYELKTGADIFKTKSGTSVASDLPELLAKHNTNEWGIAIDEDVKQVVENIQGSYSGCITFHPSFSVKFGSTNQTRTPLVKVYLKPKSQSDTTRSLAQNGAPLISSVPKRPTGAKYGWQGTQEQPVGVYQNPSEGGNVNPANSVAANLRLTYNSAIGEWESGTQQMLARLLTDVDPAKIKDIPFDSIDDIAPDEFYDTNSTYYMGQFTIGKALPISVEGGNPNMCGPNMTAAANDANKKEKIQIVNRSPRGFKKGDVVMCSHIDGEWIIQGFDAGTTSIAPVSLKLGKWSFAKFLADADSFFKDERYRSSNGKQYFQNINGIQYESYMRLRYYASMFQGGGDSAAPAISNKSISALSEMNDLNLITKLNLYVPSAKPDQPSYVFDETDETVALLLSLPSKNDYDFQPTRRYVQVTAFDQVGSHMGGTNQYNIIGRTNVIYSPDGGTNADAWYQTNFPNFWGPIFTEGYSVQQASLLKKQRNMMPMNGSARLGIQFGDPFFVVPSDGSEILSATPDKNKTIDTSNFMFSNTKDAGLYQLPAEIGVNGSLSGTYSTPIESLDELVKLESPTTNLLDTYFGFFNSRKRYTWLASVADSGNIYGLAPAQASKIQFSPLQLQYAVHAYKAFAPSDQPKYNRLRTNFFNTLTTGDTGSHMWGGLIPGNTDQGSVATRGLAPFPLIGPDTVSNGEGPLGGPDLLPDSDASSGDEKSNFVGIIVAKNKFGGGGAINFTTTQYFGLPKVQKVAGGQTGGITILPIGGGIGWVGPSNPSFTYGYPQWGSAEDSPNSFGTTALHVRIFDQWPDEQTIYDPRYFAVLHFNPLPLGMNVKSKRVDADARPDLTDWNPSKALPKYPRDVDQIETAVDFRIPTYADPIGDDEIDNFPVPINSKINRNGANNKALRPSSEWRINPIRRGQLLTGGGFRYYKRVIGLSDNYMIIDGGEGFSVDQEISLTKGAKLKVTAIGEKGNISRFIIEKKNRGEGFTPSDFSGSYKPKDSSTTYYGLRLNINGGSKSASILFHDGIVYDKLAYDACPLESTSGPVRLSLPSYRGEKASEGTNVSSVGLSPNKDGKYDAFYFFHNDILHTLLEPEAFVPGFHQYINLEIGSS